MNLYTIYDKVAEQCSPLQECANDKTACRMAALSLMKVPTALLKEYVLKCVGQVDKLTGQLEVIVPYNIDFMDTYYNIINSEVNNEKG